MPNFDNDGFLSNLAEIARSAGAVLADIRQSGNIEVQQKADGSPMTEADKQAENIIIAGLRKLDTTSDIIGEESYNGEKISDNLWLVDALDGTKEFLDGNPNFTVNIAYLQNYLPVFGLVYAPLQDKLYCGYEAQAFIQSAGKQQAIRTRPLDERGITLCSSLRHDDSAALTKLFQNFSVGDISDIMTLGSSLKFCLIAEGSADAYGRLTPTHAWDSAAGDAVLRAAGGHMLTTEGAGFTYGENILNGGFIAASGALGDKILKGGPC